MIPYGRLSGSPYGHRALSAKDTSHQVVDWRSACAVTGQPEVMEQAQQPFVTPAHTHVPVCVGAEVAPASQWATARRARTTNTNE